MDKTNILSLENDNLIINKFTNVLDYILHHFKNDTNYLNCNTINTLRISILEFIISLLGISRTVAILNKLTLSRFFESCSFYFFNLSNDILQNYIEKLIKIFIDDLNETYLEAFLLNGNFLADIINFCKGMDEGIYYKFSESCKRHKPVFVHCMKIIHLIYTNLDKFANIKKILIESPLLYDEFVYVYENFVKSYIDKMNIPLANYKGNQGKYI